MPTTLTENRINSIPSKQHNLVYDFDESGLPIILDPKALDNNVNEENEKSTINNKNVDKKINALDWSKMSRNDVSENEITTKDNTNINNSKFYCNNTSREINGVSNNTTNTSNYIRNRQISSNESAGNILNKNKRNFLNSNESITSLTNNNELT